MQRFQVHSHSQALTPTYRSLQSVASSSVQHRSSPFTSESSNLSLVENSGHAKTQVSKGNQTIPWSNWLLQKIHVPRFSDMARPLTKLLAHDCEFKWTNQCDISFQMLKDTLCSAPILKYPDTSKPYMLYI